jgi:hypothetical protein
MREYADYAVSRVRDVSREADSETVETSPAAPGATRDAQRDEADSETVAGDQPTPATS